MARGKRDFASEEFELRAQLEAKDPLALFGLRALEEEWARSLIKAKTAGPTLPSIRSAAEAGIETSVTEQCARHLASAEEWQREIASFATSGAEGLSAMREVTELQFARLYVLVASNDPALRQQARKLHRSLERASTRLGVEFKRELTRLKLKLA